MDSIEEWCSSTTTTWHIPDKRRDSLVAETIASTKPISKAVRLTKDLADRALLAHQDEIGELIRANLPAAFPLAPAGHFTEVSQKCAHQTAPCLFARYRRFTPVRCLNCEPFPGVKREMERRLVPVVERLANSVSRSERCLVRLSFVLGQHARYVLPFFRSHVQVVTEDVLLRDARMALLGILQGRFEEQENDGLSTLAAALNDLGLRSTLLEVSWEVLTIALKETVEDTCRGVYDKGALISLQSWVTERGVPFLSCITAPTHNANEEDKYWRSRLESQMLYSLAEIRIREVFDIIVDYPDSEPVLDDLKVSLMRTDLLNELATSLKKQLEERLLHAGAQTADIIAQYVSMVKVLRFIDPRGIIVEKLCEPVRAYLRNRADTIRCIVSEVTEEGGELFEVLDEESVLTHSSAESDGAMQKLNYESASRRYESFDAWEPDPADAPGHGGHGSGQFVRGDPLARLFDIFGSRDVFVEEYKTMLGNKLLFSEERGADSDREIRNVEIFKARFGSQALQDCSVMLKDVADTRRIATGATKQGGAIAENTEFLILSKEFWPKFPDDENEMPALFRDRCAVVSDHFETTKAPRKLRWHPDAGVVAVKVHLDNGKEISVSVTPNQAALFALFQTKTSWRVDELATELNWTDEWVRARAGVWIRRDLLHEPAKDVLELRVNVEDDAVNLDLMDAGAQDMQEETTQDEAGSGNEMKVYESFVLGMLTNLGSLGLDRIHNMLKMFCLSPTYDKTPEQLEDFLDDLVSEGKIAVAGRSYSLPKPS